jgi:ankyrin repeat protein
MIAAGSGAARAVEALLVHGADPGLRNPRRRTAGEIAARAGYPALARRLQAD